MGSSLDVILNQYVPKSDFGGNTFNVEYNGVEAPEGQGNGNHFLIRVYNIHAFEYLNFFIGPLSNDYSAWTPPCTIHSRIRDPATTQWGNWKILNSFLFS